MPSIDIESTRDDANMVQSGLADAGGSATSADELAEQATRAQSRIVASIPGVWYGYD